MNHPSVRAAAIVTRGNDILAVRSSAATRTRRDGQANAGSFDAGSFDAGSFDAGSFDIWGVPSAAVQAGETMAEAVVRAVASQTGLDALTSPFMGWYEELPQPTELSGPTTIAAHTPSDGAGDDPSAATVAHQVVMCFGAVVMDDRQPTAGPEVLEARWMAVWDFSELHLTDGLAELLADHGIIDTLT